MLVEPGAPDEAYRIAGLQGRAEPRRPSAAHEAEVAAVRAGHRLNDRRGLAVPADSDDEPFVAPFHGRAAFSTEREDAPTADRRRQLRVSGAWNSTSRAAAFPPTQAKGKTIRAGGGALQVPPRPSLTHAS